MEELFYVLERIYLISSIPIRCFDISGQTVLFRKGYKPEHDPVKPFSQLSLSKLKDIKHPILSFDDYLLVYGIIKESTGHLIVLGPVSSQALDKERIKMIAITHNVQEEGFFVASKTLIEISAVLALLYFYYTGEIIDEHDILHNFVVSRDDVESVNEYKYESYVTDNTENEIEHLSYSDELKYLQDVRDGNIDVMSTVTDPRLDPSRVGTLAADPLKNFEYMICASITLVTRAAIDAGVDPMRAYTLSELYFQRLETCRSESEMMRLQYDMKHDFTNLVKKSKEIRSKSSYVEKCKVYITNHLNKRFTLDDLAKEVGINKSYLSRKFAEEMKMGIKQYTLKKRVDAAANMLRFSDTDLPSISSYFCFTSQSHFGQIFKQFKGVTPQNYRNKEKVIDVIKNSQ